MHRYIMAALAFILLPNPAAADNHVWEYVAPYIPGTARTAYHNIFIVLSNQQGDPAHLDIKAHVNGSDSSVSCGTLDDLGPYEIRRYARNAGTLCVASDESQDSALRIRTAEGVHVTGYLVLSDARNRALIPLDVARVEPAGPEGISISSLTVRGLADRRYYYRVSVRLRSSSGSWPYQMVACVQSRSSDFNRNRLFNDATRNCSLPNEQLRGWRSVHGQTYINIVTHEGTHTSEIASSDYAVDDTSFHDPATFRVCINRVPVDGLLPPPHRLPNSLACRPIAQRTGGYRTGNAGIRYNRQLNASHRSRLATSGPKSLRQAPRTGRGFAGAEG